MLLIEYLLHLYMTLTITFTNDHVFQNASVINMNISKRILPVCPHNQSCIIVECLERCLGTNCK